MHIPMVNQVKVNLTSNDQGHDCIALHINGDMDDLAVCLTPAQARALATDLITAVNRVEVKANLKFSPNLWRRAGDRPTRLVASS